MKTKTLTKILTLTIALLAVCGGSTSIKSEPFNERWEWSETLGRYTYTPDPASPLGRGEHPRMGFTSETLQVLKDKISSPHYFTDYQAFVTDADKHFNDAALNPPYYGDIYALIYVLKIPGLP